ncbi:MAG: YbaB/EbfC family nucleoid-associated protein [Acidimicrobiales bacterium]
MSNDDAGAPDLGGLLGGLGGGGLGDLFAQAQAAMQASQAAADTEVEGSSGGGVVKIRATGGGEVLGVTIDPVVVDPTDVETLEDLLLAAFRDVNAKAAELHAGAMGDLDPSAMLGGLSGMLGGGATGERDEPIDAASEESEDME